MLDITTYNNITEIGDTIPALGNAKPVSFDWDRPPGRTLVGPNWATSGWGGTNSDGTGQYTDYTYRYSIYAITLIGILLRQKMTHSSHIMSS
jgi:hypothetical protein